MKFISKKMKKIIGTGGSGSIVINLIDYLIKKRYFVINIDKLTYSSNRYPNKFRSKKNYKLVKLDINDKNKLYEVIKKNKPKAIFNLAAETHVDRSIDGPKKFIQTNINGTFNLLESLRILKKKKISPKLIHISTDEVYGDIKKGKRSDENYKYEPSSPYSASKASADHLVKSYIRTYNLKAVISTVVTIMDLISFLKSLFLKCCQTFLIIKNYQFMPKVEIQGSGYTF